MLSQIGKLQDKVKILGEKLGVGPAEVGILQQQVLMIIMGNVWVMDTDYHGYMTE